MDRELLKAAAIAAGIELEWEEVGIGDPDCDPGWYCVIKGTHRGWNPLTDDGDALRLAVKLRLDIEFAPSATWLGTKKDSPVPLTFEGHNGDCPCAATRRAIVRAAAALAQYP